MTSTDTIPAAFAQPATPAIGYIRVSMAREEMISPDLQKKAILAWAKRTNHRIVQPWIEDLDKTGRNFKRRIMEAIDRVERGEVSVIAVWKYSRFGRSRTGVPANLARVEKAGGQLLSATEEVDARTAIGRFQRGMIMEFNAFESDRAGEQWMDTHQFRRDNGLPATGRPRFGYIWHPRVIHQPNGTLLIQEEKYVPDESLVSTVRELYSRSIGGEGFAALARWLNDNGHRTVRGELWSDRTLTVYMDSGFAAGYLRIHDPQCKKAPYRWNCPNHLLVRHDTKGHEAIISANMWTAYSNRRSLIRSLSAGERKARYPLSGLVRCGLCGKAMFRKRDGRRYVQFVCSQKRSKGGLGCVGATVAVAAAEEFVEQWVNRLALEVEQGATQVQSERPVPARDEDAKRARAEAELVRLERAIGRHMRAYAMSEEEDSSGALEQEYLATLRDLREQKRRVTADLEVFSATPSAAELEAQRLVLRPVALGLAREWDTLEPGRINELLRGLLTRVDVHRDGVVSVVPAWSVEPAPSIHQ